MRIDYPRRGRDGWRRFIPSWRQWLGIFALGGAALVAAFIALYLLIDVPEPNDLATAQTSVVYYDDGKDIIGRYAEVNREIVALDDIPEEVQLAVLAAEDRGFYENEGISPVGIVRALWNNVTGGETQGASTITQQYARNAYLTQERTITRKVKEAILAIKLSRSQSKDAVLEDYLNTIYFGRGAYGVQAASQAYFGKDVEDLNVQQGAVLAALIRAPSSYDPAEGKEARDALEARVDYVIEGMVEQGWLDEAEATSIGKLPKIKDPKALNSYRGQTGYMLDMVRDELRSLGFSKDEIDAGGLRVTTTFNEQAQDAAQQAATEGFPPEPNDGVKMGLASLDPTSGAVLAIYGGKNWEKSQYNYATGAIPVGSTMKAFTVAAALEDGFTLADTFDGNSPFYIEGDPQPVNNQGGASYGSAISLEYATEQSVNTAFVDLTEQMGPERVAEAANAAGLNTSNLDASGPRVTLGSASYSPLAMAGAYGTFANQGTQHDPYTVQEVTDASGRVLYAADDGGGVRSFSPDIANQVTYDLTQVVANGTGATASNLGRPAAGKTGNQEGVTAWFIGYTPQMVTSVAFHRELKGDKLAPLNYVAGMPVFTGAGYPTSIWTAYMTMALEGEPIEEFPPVALATPSPTASPSPSPSRTSESPTPTPTRTSSSPSASPTKTTAEPSESESTPSSTPTEDEDTGGGGNNG
ncbi:MAG TPA: transglycosylase domain-containing protein [Actinomycetes bacterium]|nr:transglycosylase domain-containing protein [Actinomycetes bacterium]